MAACEFPDDQQSEVPPGTVVTPDPAAAVEFDLAIASDLGTERVNNEDAFGFIVEDADRVVFAVADGVGGYEGGEVASRMAIDVTLDAYRTSPTAWGAAKRLARAAQRANITIHDRALIVTELRRMATTLTAVSISSGVLCAVHVGDCRLYLIRAGHIKQLSKDHTAGARTRLGVLDKETLREHPERGGLTRSLGPELIVAVDRIMTRLAQGDMLLVASDGLHDTLSASEILALAEGRSASEACRALIDSANTKGTHDNLTVAVFRQTSPVLVEQPAGVRARLENLLGSAFRRK
jgi:serine/threonine protein phosphatase PrpC